MRPQSFLVLGTVGFLATLTFVAPQGQNKVRAKDSSDARGAQSAQSNGDILELLFKLAEFHYSRRKLSTSDERLFRMICYLLRDVRFEELGLGESHCSSTSRDLESVPRRRTGRSPDTPGAGFKGQRSKRRAGFGVLLRGPAFRWAWRNLSHRHAYQSLRNSGNLPARNDRIYK